MKKRKIIISLLIVCVTIIITLVLSIGIWATRLINTEFVKDRVTSTFSQKIGGSLEFKSLDLSIFPRPCLSMYEGNISVPEIGSGFLDSAVVYPRILPLAIGKLRIAKVEIESPQINLNIPKQRPESEDKKKQVTISAIKDQTTGLLSLLAQQAPGLLIELKKGSLNLSAERTSLMFQDLDARVVLPPARLKLTIKSSSNLWENVSIKADVNPENLHMEGQINLVNFRAQELTDYYLKNTDLKVGASQGNVNINFISDDFSSINADLQGTLDYLAVHKLDKEIVFKSENIKGNISIKKGRTAIHLQELALEYPKLKMDGKLIMDKKSEQITLVIRAQNMDVDSTREVILALAGDIPVTQKIFDIVRGGEIPEISFVSEGKTFPDLDNKENFVVKGSMSNGEISVPKVDLDLKDVKGEVVISDGILEGKNLEARLENEQGRDGTLRIGLKGKDAPFHLEMNLDVDLSQVPSLLKRLVKNEAFVKEITQIVKVKGQAKGRLILGESLKSIRSTVDVEEFNLSADYERIPYALEISGGQLFYDKTKVRVKNLTGSVGQSSFSELDANIDLRKDPHLEIVSGKASINLEETYSWISSYEKLKPGLKEIHSINGTLDISALNLKGLLLKPGDWNFQGSGDGKTVIMNTTLVPGPIKISRGKFNLDQDILSIENTQIIMMDASYTVSGSFDRYLEGLYKTDLNYSGTIGPEATEFLSDFINLPSRLRLKSPISVSQAHLDWERDVRTMFKGKLVMKEGTEVSLDLLHSPEEFALNNLLIHDEESHASLGLVLKENEFSFNFDGNLSDTSMNKIFLKPMLQKEWMRGNFEARILTTDPRNSSAKGKLEGKNLIFPWKLKVPLTINSFILDASNNQVNVQSGDLTLGDNRFAVKGGINFSPAGFDVNMDISSDGVDWETISKAFKTERDDKKGETFWDAPVLGNLQVKSKYFSYDRFTWKSLHADISFARDAISINVTNASVCGVSSPGSIKVTPENISLNFQPNALNQELEPAAACILGISRHTTGKFDLKSNVKSEGKSEEIVNSLQGDLQFNAKKGRIYQYGVTAKIFSFLNLTEIFRGRLPDLVQEGFAYKSIKAKAELMGSTLHFNEFVIDGSSMNIASQGDINIKDKTLDLKVLVSPLKTADAITRLIPIVKDITGGTLVTIPVNVKGDFDNLKVNYLPASAVGSGLMGIMKNTLKAPIKIFLPNKKEKEE